MRGRVFYEFAVWILKDVIISLIILVVLYIWLLMLLMWLLLRLSFAEVFTLYPVALILYFLIVSLSHWPVFIFFDEFIIFIAQSLLYSFLYDLFVLHLSGQKITLKTQLFNPIDVIELTGNLFPIQVLFIGIIDKMWLLEPDRVVVVLKILKRGGVGY